MSELNIADLAAAFSSWAWGPWLIALLLGGGLFFLGYSRFLPYRYFGHAWALLRGRYDDASGPGQLTHYQALSAALASTVGLGNIAGVALAISIGGPGAIFWMWMTAIVGTATKFYTCTLAVMYRGKDDEGTLQGGPMYLIREAMPRWALPLAYLFAIFGMIGTLPAFQANQLVAILRDQFAVETGLLGPDTNPVWFNLPTGLIVTAVSAWVIFGGLTRIAAVTSRMVPFMAVLYLGAVAIALLLNITAVPGAFVLIVTDAFTGSAAAGGAVGSVIMYGVRRGAFSNEAGLGTEALVHGAARTREPVREGLVAMQGPVIDTLLVCTATALMILVSGVWETESANGVTLTADAFRALLGPIGPVLLLVAVICFSTTTIFTQSFYGSQCAAFLFGSRARVVYRACYVGFIVIASIVSLRTVINVIDGAYALMAIPTMISALYLSPRVMAEARRYFSALDSEGRATADAASRE